MIRSLREVAISTDTYFAVTFRTPDEGQVSTLKVREVGDSDLGPGFVCISGFVFETGSRLLNPTEEALAKRYENVRRLHLNVFAIQSIAEIGVELKLEQDRSNLVVLPTRPAD